MGSRTVQAFALAAAMVGAIVAVRPREIHGLAPDQVRQVQLHWRHCADVVLGGDSRVQAALCPAEMSACLGGVRVRNFGFDSAGYAPEYLQALRKVLDPCSPRKRVVLGITPLSLTRASRQDSGFVDALKVSAQKSLVLRSVGQILLLFEPARAMRSLVRIFRPTPQIQFERTYHWDGWRESDTMPPSPEYALADYRSRLGADGRALPQARQDILDFVRSCTRDGIEVFAFRPPTTPEMVQLETKMTGFDEADFARAFVAAGGVWFDIPSGGYRTHDGSHLQRDSAIQFSRDLSDRIGRTELSPSGASVGNARIQGGNSE